MKPLQLALIILAIGFAVLIVWAFTLLPYDHPGQAIDWKLFHQATHGFQIEYANNRVYNPPWVLALLWPITIFPLELSRGIWALITLAVFVLTVPRVKNRWWFAATPLLLFSYPMVRHLMDGNLEAVIVGGVFLALYSMQRRSLLLLGASLILLSSKIQETWLFLVALTIVLGTHWSWRQWVKSYMGAGFFTIPFLIWKGPEWWAAIRSFPYSESLNDSSLRYALTRLAVNEWIAWIIWALVLVVTFWLVFRPNTKIDLRRTALLVTAGMLLSNYTAGDSLVTPLALGVIPLFIGNPAIGLPLLFFYFLPYVFITNVELRLAWENIYWALVLLITWAVLAWDLYRHPHSQKQSV